MNLNDKSESRKTESGNLDNVQQKFLQSHFLQSDQKGLNCGN